jgi:hypothetical protein
MLEQDTGRVIYSKFIDSLTSLHDNHPLALEPAKVAV